MSKTVYGWRAARLLFTSAVLGAAFAGAVTANAQEQTQTPAQTPTPAPTQTAPQQTSPTPSTQPSQTPAPAQTTPAQTTPPAQGETVAAPAPAAEPLYREYKGVKLGMKADEARGKLGTPQEKDKVQDFFVLSETERARVYYDDKGEVSAVIVTYVGRGANAPDAKTVLGSEIEAKPDGSAYKLVTYPEAGYWVAYSRTAGDEPLTIITMQKTK
ncbi:MAG TPA: hypothetical protein VN228_08680 [Pyrinomonadaceae bacterium]|nr:hypothetical protein [Pyrinomonadaceae bacterium]